MMNSNAAGSKERKRARLTAVIYSTLTIFSLLMLVYAFIQRIQAETFSQRVKQLEIELDGCKAQTGQKEQNH
jgi:heme/copper-type cytochrome/quinol oxidase subunit 3